MVEETCTSTALLSLQHTTVLVCRWHKNTYNSHVIIEKKNNKEYWLLQLNINEYVNTNSV